jgi:hypothetical protein
VLVLAAIRLLWFWAVLRWMPLLVTLAAACQTGSDVDRGGSLGTTPPQPLPAPGEGREGPPPDRGGERPAREVVVAAGGDVLIHRRVLESAQAHEGGFGYVLGAFRQAIDEVEADRGRVMTFVNQETPLTEAYVDPVNTHPPMLGSPPELAAALRALGVDVISVANNHAFDQNADGLADTLATARAAGLGVVGAGEDAASSLRPWTVERNGLVIGVLGFTNHVNQGPGAHSRVPMQIARLRETDAAPAAIAAARRDVDVLVVAVHWSSDFTKQPASSQRRLARELVEAGADLILGTGPHVPQEVERLQSPRGDALVAYSLGNLISNQGLQYTAGHRIRPDEHPVAITPGTRDAPVLAVRLRAPEQGRVEIVAADVVGLWTANNFWERRTDESIPVDVRLVRLRDVDPATREERLRVLGGVLGPAVRLLP